MQIRGRLCETGEVVTVTLTGGRITAVASVAASAASYDLGGDDLWLAPGFIDQQVNGYKGQSFNLAPLDAGNLKPEEPSAASMAEIARKVVAYAARSGTALLCPTICTGSREWMLSCLACLARACEEDPALARALPAFHVEGPYLASEDGPRGAHPREHIRDPDWEELEAFQAAARGRIRILTLAPERHGALRFIERVAEAGVVVALGHTAATPEQIRDAVQAGATMSTHLGNGAHAQLARHPNYIWEQLAADELHASIIADGHHLPPAVVKSMARIKGPKRLCLVSDAIALGGCPPGIYNDGRYEVLATGKVVLAGTPYLAGGGHLLDTGVANAVRFTGWPLADVVRTVTTNPAVILGIQDRAGAVAPGLDAHLTLFRLPESGPLEIAATLRGGEVVYRKVPYSATP